MKPRSGYPSTSGSRRRGFVHAPIQLTRYGSVSTALHILNAFLLQHNKAIVVTIDKSGFDIPDKPTQAEENQARILDVQIMSVTEARKEGYKS